jgi:hypothetical protein
MVTVTGHDLDRQIREFERCVNERDRVAAEAVLDEDFALVLVQPEAAVMPRSWQASR